LEAIRPVLVPLLAVYIPGYLILVGVVSVAAVFFARSLFSVLTGMAASFGGIILAILLASAFWVRFTEEYSTSNNVVRIRRGYFSREEHNIPRGKIVDLQVVLPLALRPFDVGFVRVLTNDGFRYSLKNVRNPSKIVQELL
jgi:uncharacterized membrane protein YdbT with pleckstrin-like domain